MYLYMLKSNEGASRTRVQGQRNAWGPPRGFVIATLYAYDIPIITVFSQRSLRAHRKRSLQTSSRNEFYAKVI
eukprot:6209142-Pleurochrysis_carterae.AAC.2